MTTLEQLQDLTDEQLIEKVAVEVMQFPQGRMDGEMVYRIGDSVVYAKWLTERWNPLTDWNHTMEVLGRIENRRGIRMSHLPFKGPKGASYVEVWSVWVEGCGEAVVHHSLQRAILIAALLAVSPLPPKD